MIHHTPLQEKNQADKKLTPRATPNPRGTPPWPMAVDGPIGPGLGKRRTSAMTGGQQLGAGVGLAGGRFGSMVHK